MMMIDLSCKVMKKMTICQLNDLTGEKNIFLVMQGIEERREVCHQGVKQFEVNSFINQLINWQNILIHILHVYTVQALMKGDGYEVEPMKAFYKEMCR